MNYMISNCFKNCKNIIKSIDYSLKEHTLFKDSMKAKFKSNIIIIVLIYFMLWLSGFYVGHLISNQTAKFLTSNYSFDKSIIFSAKKFISCGIQILIFFAWVVFVEKRSIKTLGFNSKNFTLNYIIGMFVGFFAISAITAFLVLSKTVIIESYNLNTSILMLGTIAVAWIVQSASEEIAIRGWLIPSLGNKSTPLVSIAITSIIFGILHLFSSGVTVLSFLNLILSGIFFACYAIYSENIWGVCGMHFSWNFTLGNIYGFAVSGFSSEGESLIKIKQAGSNIFTGGSFGPEGGIITTIILLIGIFVFSVKFIKKFNSNFYQPFG